MAGLFGIPVFVAIMLPDQPKVCVKSQEYFSPSSLHASVRKTSPCKSAEGGLTGGFLSYGPTETAALVIRSTAIHASSKSSPRSPSESGNFFAELKRRNIYKLVIAYGVVT
jgi:hypothetical protein